MLAGDGPLSFAVDPAHALLVVGSSRGLAACTLALATFPPTLRATAAVSFGRAEQRTLTAVRLRASVQAGGSSEQTPDAALALATFIGNGGESGRAVLWNTWGGAATLLQAALPARVGDVWTGEVRGGET